MTKNSGIFYRGTAGEGKGTGLGALGNGVYLTWTEGMAKAFADRVGGEVKKYKVKPGLKMADALSLIHISEPTRPERIGDGGLCL